MKIHSIEADNFKLFTTNFHKIRIRQITRLPEKVSPPDRGGES